jgi:hypothetical protein
MAHRYYSNDLFGRDELKMSSTSTKADAAVFEESLVWRADYDTWQLVNPMPVSLPVRVLIFLLA